MMTFRHQIKVHAETYSFLVESILFNQLTNEQQLLWRKEIEQAVISGGETGFELANNKGRKHLITKAEKWLSEIHRVCDITDEKGYKIDLRELITSFEEYMECKNN